MYGDKNAQGLDRFRSLIRDFMMGPRSVRPLWASSYQIPNYVENQSSFLRDLDTKREQRKNELVFEPCVSHVMISSSSLPAISQS